MSKRQSKIIYSIPEETNKVNIEKIALSFENAFFICLIISEKNTTFSTSKIILKHYAVHHRKRTVDHEQRAGLYHDIAYRK